jgi:hypothetical protein
MTSQEIQEGAGNGAYFTLSYPPSLASSRSSSPGPNPLNSLKSDKGQSNLRKDKHGTAVEDIMPEKLPEDVYEATLPRWRAVVRQKLVGVVQRESEVIAKMQVRYVI